MYNWFRTSEAKKENCCRGKQQEKEKIIFKTIIMENYCQDVEIATDEKYRL